MKLIISKDKMINEVQDDFSRKYPFLKLEFYKKKEANSNLPLKKHLLHSISLKAAGIKKSGTIDIKDEMTVGELENTFLQKFGLAAQVSRKSGIVWLETTMTDNWSLQKQNDYGKEITLGVKRNIPDEPIANN